LVQEEAVGGGIFLIGRIVYIITAVTQVAVLLEHLSRLADFPLMICTHNINNGKNPPFIIKPPLLQLKTTMVHGT
jgi:hypothetical protein